MDFAIVLSVVQTLLSAIQTLDQLKPMFSISDCKHQLAELQNSVEAVKSVLEDAADKEDALNNQERFFIKELKDAVYDADDVIDEFVTLAKRKQLSEASDKISDKVRSFLSRFKHITHGMSTKIKQVNTKLDTIATKSSKFSFRIGNKPTRFRKEETSCFVSGEDKIFGREEDVEKIIGVLLESDVDQPNNSFLAIVGMGGLGKTALAQLVYNDTRIIDAFQLKSWTCIADQDQEHWSLTELLGKVLRDLQSEDNKHDFTSLQQMQYEIKNQLGGKKYLLVLDDVWTEVYHRWQELEDYLKVGLPGSRIVVTTRSNKMAQMVGGGRVHEIGGLSREESWNLFKKMAFLPEQRETFNVDLVKIGKEIVQKCMDAPLAIRVVGSLLRGQSKSKWLSFQDKGLANVSESDDTMNHILKLSYHQLDSPLKSCFAYCAIFPKDYVISKQKLIWLWMAQGYVSAEHVGKEYIFMLLQRCFFQEVRVDNLGEIKSFKIHDLLHDIAEQVAGEEICRLSSSTPNICKRGRHLSLMDSYTNVIFNVPHLRTCLQVRQVWEISLTNQLLVGRLIANWTCLRTLDLSEYTFEALPESIGKLLHLRFLDLSRNTNLRVLPKSITKLVNLQTLDLGYCTKLKELPKDASKLVNLQTLDLKGCKLLKELPEDVCKLVKLQTLNLAGCWSLNELSEDVSKLVNLRTLNLSGCNGLSHMPSSMGMLTSLRNLGRFVVGVPSSSGNQCFGGLEDLKSLNNLKGNLVISIKVCQNAKFVKEDHGGGEYLRSKEHLKRIDLEFEKGSFVIDQVLFEEMQPHPNLRALGLKNYHGVSLPRWPSGNNSALPDLPNLSRLVISDCPELQSLPLEAGKLPCLKALELLHLRNLEYVVNGDPEVAGSDGAPSFFPCLEILGLSELPTLKGWWPRSSSRVQNDNLIWASSPRLAQLKLLRITSCPRMAFIPVCPCLEDLKVADSSRNLTWGYMSHIPRDYQSLFQVTSKPKILSINDLEWLKSMPNEYFQSVAMIAIQYENKVESLAEVSELLQTRFTSSLRFLRISRSPSLRSVGGLEHLHALVILCIVDCPNLLDGVPWRHLPRSLQRLELLLFGELEELPEEMQHCTSLQHLLISDCPMLHFLPNWMPKLTSLERLELRFCSPTLKERCRKPNGEDWPFIQHIRLICVRAEIASGGETTASDDDEWANDIYERFY